MQASIAAMPGLKAEVGRRLDALIGDAVPGVAKAVKWNGPFHGADPGRWFPSFHRFTRYVKVTFFDGDALDPPPPEPSKTGRARYAHIHEGDAFEAGILRWVGQARHLPGERLQAPRRIAAPSLTPVHPGHRCTASRRAAEGLGPWA